jgi:hypothetical protein
MNIALFLRLCFLNIATQNNEDALAPFCYSEDGYCAFYGSVRYTKAQFSGYKIKPLSFWLL